MLVKVQSVGGRARLALLMGWEVWGRRVPLREPPPRMRWAGRQSPLASPSLPCMRGLLWLKQVGWAAEGP